MLQYDTQPIASLSLLELREYLPADLKKVRAMLWKRRFHPDIIEDAVGHACIIASEVIDGERNNQFPAHAAWMAWLFKTAFNEARKLFKRRRHYDQIEDRDVPIFYFKQWEKEQKLKALLAAIKVLPTLLRDLVVFCYLDGHSYAEAAEQFDLPNVKHQLDKAKERLRRIIADSPYS